MFERLKVNNEITHAEWITLGYLFRKILEAMCTRQGLISIIIASGFLATQLRAFSHIGPIGSFLAGAFVGPLVCYLAIILLNFFGTCADILAHVGAKAILGRELNRSRVIDQIIIFVMSAIALLPVIAFFSLGDPDLPYKHGFRQ